MARLRTLAFICLVTALLAQSAIASRDRFAYKVMVNTRVRGGLQLVRGDRVVCRNPGRWLIVTLPAPNASGVMLAAAKIVSVHYVVQLSVTKNVVTGRGVITCTRIRR
jgi:hypothetical protein